MAALSQEQLGGRKPPRHIAVIMDGNGRWASAKGRMRVLGHKNAIKSVRETIEGSAELGVEYLTLYAFSTENWSRPQPEVEALMQLLLATMRQERKTLMENNLRLTSIGETERLPEKCRAELAELERITASNARMTVTLALSYGARSDIARAARQLCRDALEHKLAPDDIDTDLFSRYLSAAYMPDPELLIRTSGELRVSNFLLWEIAYAELYITTKLWPDFRKADLLAAVQDYLGRERRFGKTSEQVV